MVTFAKNQDVVITIGADIEQLRAQLSMTRKLLRKNFSAIEATRASGLTQQIKGLTKQQTLLGRSVLGLPKDYDKSFTNINRDLQKLSGYTRPIVDGTKVMNRAVRTSVSRLDNDLRKVRGRFQGWALSIMFFGMALQRVFTSIWRNSTKVFQDVMHSTDDTTTGFDMLGGSLKFLGFTVGAALEPVATFLAPIIDKIADWVSQNSKLVRTIVTVGFALGFILTVFGMLTLAVNGFMTLGRILATKFTAVYDVFRRLGNLQLIPLKNALISIRGLMATGLISAIILVMFWLFKLGQKMGGLGELWKNALRGLLRIGAIVASAIGAVFGVAFEWIANKLNWLIDKYNNFLLEHPMLHGMAIGAGLGGTVERIPTTGFSLKEMYAEMLHKADEGINKVLGEPEVGFQDITLKEFMAMEFGKATTPTVEEKEEVGPEIVMNNEININTPIGEEHMKEVSEKLLGDLKEQVERWI